MKDFNYSNNLIDIQNQLIAQSIRDSSNLQLAKTEEAIKSVMQSYIDRFNKVGGMLTDISKYIVQSKTLIKIDTFNKLFESIYIDFLSLYKNLETVDNVLSLNLNRNKLFYFSIKKKIRDLWNQLELVENSILTDTNSSSIIYESFQNDINISKSKDIFIDKKNGIIHLNTVKKQVINKSFNIKSVVCNTYPSDNIDGGVYYSSNTLNSFNENYSSGSHDLLENGLWKEEVICNDIPSLLLNIGSSVQKLYKSFDGIVSVIDIEFASNISFNRFDIDVFCDSYLNLDSILYKSYNEDTWKYVKSNNQSVSMKNFDIISQMNIDICTCRFLRIVLNQKNYTILTQLSEPSLNIDEQVKKDLSERRYELVKFDKNIYNLAVPNNSNNISLYNKIINVIETTRDINKILNKIEKILIPDINVLKYDYHNTYKYEIGAWSIEPILEKYTSNTGFFKSSDYLIDKGTPISITIDTIQSTPDLSTCNWYITYNNKNIPILENKNTFRREKIKNFDMSKYLDFSLWNGTFMLLDFPVDPSKLSYISIYENGIKMSINYTDIIFLNSKLIYIDSISKFSKLDYVIEYYTPINSCVNLWALRPNDTNISNINDIPLGVVSSRRDFLELFINNAKINITGEESYLSSFFIIENFIALKDEAMMWFGSTFNTCLFISSELLEKNIISFDINSYITISSSKISGNINIANDYLNSNIISSCDYSLIGSTCNLISSFNKDML